MNLKLTTKTRLIAILVIFASLSWQTANADDDFGWWQSIEASKKINSKWEIALEAEQRTADNARDFDRFDIGLSASYKLFSFLKLNAGYSFLYTHKPEEIDLKDIDNGFQEYNVEDAYWVSRHRFYVTATGSVKWKRFTFSLRERLQYTYQGETTNTQTKYRYSGAFGGLIAQDPEEEIINAKNKTIVRSRLMAKWDIKGCKIEPFASFELYNWANNGWILDKTRFAIGADYKITKKSSIELYYLYQHQTDDGELSGHVVGLGYAIEF